MLERGGWHGNWQAPKAKFAELGADAVAIDALWAVGNLVRLRHLRPCLQAALTPTALAHWWYKLRCCELLRARGCESHLQVPGGLMALHGPPERVRL